jgi:hypothetical protein
MLPRDHGDGLDLKEHVFPEQAAHLGKGTGRWRGRVDVLVAYLPEDGEVSSIQNIVVELHHVLKPCACGSEGDPQILEDLPSLRAEIAGADEVAGGIQGYLPGEKQEALPWGHLRHVAVSARR